jgi:[ribosomal protein S18]-alanine N-acetyltransferase
VNFEYKIRAAKSDDLEKIYRIESEAYRSPWSVEGLVSEVASQNSRFFVAEQDGKILGYILIWIVLDELHLLKIATASAYRRHGIASALIDYVVKEFKRASVLYLEVREKNTIARNFYKKLGFVENGKRMNYYADDNAVLIEKRIK